MRKPCVRCVHFSGDDKECNECNGGSEWKEDPQYAQKCAYCKWQNVAHDGTPNPCDTCFAARNYETDAEQPAKEPLGCMIERELRAELSHNFSVERLNLLWRMYKECLEHDTSASFFPHLQRPGVKYD